MSTSTTDLEYVQANFPAQADYLAECHPETIPLLANGWTLDAAVNHVTGHCDQMLCTGQHGPTLDDLATLIREALVAARHAGYLSGHFVGGGESLNHAEANQAAEAKAVQMWRTFYDVVSN